jgi:hypothetical protein
MDEIDDLAPFWRIGKKSIVEAVSDEARKRGLRVHAIEQNQLMIENRCCQVLPGKLIPGDRKECDSVRLYPPFSWPTDVFIYVVRSEANASAHTIFVLPAQKRFKGGAWAISYRMLQPFKDGWNLLTRSGSTDRAWTDSCRREHLDGRRIRA